MGSALIYEPSRNLFVRLPERRSNTSVKCENWLCYLEQLKNVNIIREFRIPGTNYSSDGYFQDQKHVKHVFEFLGCFYHGHIADYDEKDLVAGGKTAREVYTSTLQRINVIRNLGYKVTVIWECDYDKLVTEKPVFFDIFRKV